MTFVCSDGNIFVTMGFDKPRNSTKYNFANAISYFALLINDLTIQNVICIFKTLKKKCLQQA